PGPDGDAVADGSSEGAADAGDGDAEEGAPAPGGLTGAPPATEPGPGAPDTHAAAGMPGCSAAQATGQAAVAVSTATTSDSNHPPRRRQAYDGIATCGLSPLHRRASTSPLNDAER